MVTRTRSFIPVRAIAADLHFNNVIVMHSQRPINYGIRRFSQAWPKRINILSDKDLDRSSPYELLHTVGAFPSRNSYGAAALEFESNKIPLDLAIPALRYWWSVHEKIITYLVSIQEWKQYSRDPSFIYNLTWARMQYIMGQPANVMAMYHKIQFDPFFRKSSMLQDSGYSQ
jgi:hypothetical protein